MNYIAEGKRVLQQEGGSIYAIAVANSEPLAQMIVDALRVRASLRDQQQVLRTVTTLKKEPSQ